MFGSGEKGRVGGRGPRGVRGGRPGWRGGQGVMGGGGGWGGTMDGAFTSCSVALFRVLQNLYVVLDCGFSNANFWKYMVGLRFHSRYAIL